MDWQREFEALPERDKEQFSRLLSLLFDQTFLLRDVWDAQTGRLTSNREYRFAERVRPLLEAYLAVSGWALQVDSLRGVMALYNRYGRNRQTLDKLTTYILFILRLIYDEQLEQVSGRREVLIWLRDVYEKLHAFGFTEKKISMVRLQTTMMKLRRLSVIERTDGEGLQPDSRWIVYPTIRILVSDERINQIYEKIEQEPWDSEEEGEDELPGVYDTNDSEEARKRA
ncbi:hypothetical protein GCM10025857_12520 [Alicyclobacillus contaminans]|uniref:DUF4194 domain-containing protein n=1 Tax=Alicyclobacillus contaminans TaxID=392016 RepID=UPI0006863A92|nr:DUF4194 domain-containing protein [Alicyclobacillus contaminans]GMA49895.1 hypothetical protein GCM10025857_12520 [Alicyclobacillus contaminans]